MNVKEYLEGLKGSSDVTFIVAKPYQYESAPSFYGTQYYQTPIRSRAEWLDCSDKFLSKLVINKDHSPIDITNSWCNRYKNGRLKCCIIADTNYLTTLYSEKQAKDMEEYYKNKVK